MGAPSGQFLRLLNAPPPPPPPPGQFVSLPIWGPLRPVSSLITMWGSLRSVSLHTIGGVPSDQFLWLLCGGPFRSGSSHTIWAPLMSVSSFTIWSPPQINFFADYVGAPSDQFLGIPYEPPPPRSISLHNNLLIYSMCSLVVSVLDSPAVDPGSNPGSGSGSALLMSEKSQAVYYISSCHMLIDKALSSDKPNSL